MISSRSIHLLWIFVTRFLTASMILRVRVRGNFWYIFRMRLLYVADGRSPIARNWMQYFIDRGDEVYLASTFACPEDLAVRGLEITPVAFSGTKKSNQSAARSSTRTLGVQTLIRHLLGPLTIPRASQRLRSYIERVKPDLVHAMRIPYEGMLAADAYTGIPLLISAWGNDFTFHATSSSIMRHYTHWTMKVADAYHADCQRDIRLGKYWGFNPSRPTLVTPGNGGIRTEWFHPPATPVAAPVILNPRGFRSYVRNDVFFQAIPRVLVKRPDAKFVCAAMPLTHKALHYIDTPH